jgi:membrane associated rhomboid family serine protease
MIYRGYRRSGINPIFVIIGVNFLLFIATLTSRELFFLFGLQPASFLERPWTIVTNMFIHAGFGHIFGNMLTLFFFGLYLAGLVGDKRFLIVYFGGGLLGNILYILLANPLALAVGASGAVYAVAGALVIMRPKLRVLLYFFIPMPLWLVISVFFVIWSFIPGVAWQAHLGGLIFGIAAGFIFRRSERRFF